MENVSLIALKSVILVCSSTIWYLLRSHTFARWSVGEKAWTLCLPFNIQPLTMYGSFEAATSCFIDAHGAWYSPNTWYIFSFVLREIHYTWNTTNWDFILFCYMWGTEMPLWYLLLFILIDWLLFQVNGAVFQLSSWENNTTHDKSCR